MATIDQVLIFVKPDGSIITTYFLDNAIRSGADLSSHIENERQKVISQDPQLNGLPYFIKTKSDIRALIAGRKGLKRAIRCDQYGNLSIDDSYVPESQIRKQTAESAREKLKTGQPLNDTEIDLILKKEN